MDAFELGDPEHLVALVAVLGSALLAFRAGGSRFGPKLASALAALLVFYAIGLQLFRLRDGLQLSLDLPLWLCDVVFLLCIWCCFKPPNWVLSAAVYWGLAGTLQAMITPDIQQGFPSTEFLLFMIGHGLVVATVAFLLGLHRGWWSPDPASRNSAFLSLLVYTAAVGAINGLFGWNYGYLCEKPMGASVLDFMGPWPVYVGTGLLLAAILFQGVRLLLSLLLRDRD